jgi:hypothetical protein
LKWVVLRFYVERPDSASSLHELVLGPAVDEVKRLADVPQSEAFVAAREAVEELRVMS